MLLVNLVLLLLAAAGVWRLHSAWQVEQAREQAMAQRKTRPLPPPPHTPLSKPADLRPADYLDIAQKNLFSRDRNPIVVVETKAPPPKVMPPLPIFRGVMNLGDGPMAILSEKKGALDRDFRPGDRIGEFTLVAVNSSEVVLEWDGKQIRKPVEELEDHTAPHSEPPPAPAAAPRAPARPPQPASQLPARAEPGVDIGRGLHACVPGDTSPAGTTSNGLRKVVEPGVFGQQCWWEPAK